MQRSRSVTTASTWECSSTTGTKPQSRSHMILAAELPLSSGRQAPTPVFIICLTFTIASFFQDPCSNALERGASHVGHVLGPRADDEPSVLSLLLPRSSVSQLRETAPVWLHQALEVGTAHFDGIDMAAGIEHDSRMGVERHVHPHRPGIKIA